MQIKYWKTGTINNYIMMNHLVKNVLIKKSNELNLKNYKIKLLILFYFMSYFFGILKSINKRK